MRLIDRLQEYLTYEHISAYSFEHACGLSNGYLGKQLRGRGSVGSDILERIKAQYTDLSLIWLITGKGSMLLLPARQSQKTVAVELNEEQKIYFTAKDDVIRLLNKQIQRMESCISDKEKIIEMLEAQLRERAQQAYKKSR